MRAYFLSGLLLCLLCVAAYWPVGGNGFVNYDDPLYVTANPIVKQGLTWPGVVWAFTQANASNYHPVTWLSHMLDCQLFFTNAAAHHFVSLFIHTINSILVFLVMRWMTGRAMESIALACLFAVHPAHVESVAWVAERKDVLSGTFFLLTIAAYAWYVRSPGAGKFVLVLALLALGLLSKAMLVTTPAVLLLLDCWPLKRQARWGALLREKAPMVALAGAIAVVTFLVQREAGAMNGGGVAASLAGRAGNAAVAYVRYLATFAWPTDLAVFYPRQVWHTWQVAGAAALLAAITGIAFAMRASRPYVLVGWLWFLGTLIPVIGLIQVGSQSMADRYLYLPMIGLAVAIVWGTSELLANRARLAMSVCAAAVLIACTIATHRQTKVWKDDVSLYTQCLRVTHDNAFVRTNLAAAMVQKGDLDRAIVHYRRAVEIQPDLPDARGGYGYALRLTGRLAEAEAQLKAGLRLNELDPRLHAELGLIYLLSRRFPDAQKCFVLALQLDPHDAESAYHLKLVRVALHDRNTMPSRDLPSAPLEVGDAASQP